MTHIINKLYFWHYSGYETETQKANATTTRTIQLIYLIRYSGGEYSYLAKHARCYTKFCGGAEVIIRKGPQPPRGREKMGNDRKIKFRFPKKWKLI